MTDPKEIHARIEMIAKDGGFIEADIEVTGDDDNPATVLARFIGVNIQELNTIAQREHKRLKEATAPSPIKVPEPRIAGPDGKPLN